jgi:hypothetical protein
MGLTIHYSFKSGGSERRARTLVERLHSAAKDLPFKEVGDLTVFEGDRCDFEKVDKDDPNRWLLIQAGKTVTVAPPEKRGDGWTTLHEVRVVPNKIIAFIGQEHVVLRLAARMASIGKRPVYGFSSFRISGIVKACQVGEVVVVRL